MKVKSSETFVRARVILDVTKPFPAGCGIPRVDLPKIWFMLKGYMIYISIVASWSMLIRAAQKVKSCTQIILLFLNKATVLGYRL